MRRTPDTSRGASRDRGRPRAPERFGRDNEPRGGGSPRPERRPPGPPPAGHVRYRLEVGNEHRVQPGNIVGAIANEAGIDSAHIGRISIFDDYSTVDLPEGMPPDTFEHLRKTWVCGRKLAISVEVAGASKPAGGTREAAARKVRAGQSAICEVAARNVDRQAAEPQGPPGSRSTRTVSATAASTPVSRRRPRQQRRSTDAGGARLPSAAP